MITAHGYSKDPSIIPEGIAITWVEKKLLEWYGTMERFERYLTMKFRKPDMIWYQDMRAKPKREVLYVYIIIGNIVKYRVNYVGYENGQILMCGPLVKAPIELNKPGFQGFRYITKLF